MNAPQSLAVLQAPALHRVALAAVQGVHAQAAPGPEAAWLAAAADPDAPPGSGLQAWLAEPPESDRLLHALARALPLQPAELVAVALAMAVELDALAARVVAWLQAPAGGSRPTVGLVLSAVEALGLDPSAALLLDGRARETGLLSLDTEQPAPRPLPEQPLRVPLPLVLALRDGASRWPGVNLGAARAAPVPSLREAAQRQARALRRGPTALAVRSGHPRAPRPGSRRASAKRHLSLIHI